MIISNIYINLYSKKMLQNLPNPSTHTHSHTNLTLYLYILILLLYSSPTSSSFSLQITYPQPFNKQHRKIYTDSILQQAYNDTIYKKTTTCTNGQLSVLEFNKTVDSNVISIVYEGIDVDQSMIKIETSMVQPQVRVNRIDQVGRVIYIGCGCKGEDTNTDNYFNKVDVVILKQGNEQGYRFSFLLGCDKGGRNKKFEIGYIIIAVINAAITIGVALHSRIWSIRYSGRPLSIELKWHRFVIIMTGILIMGISLYLYASADQFINANHVISYLGLILAYIFSFICSDEIFFLVRAFKKQIYNKIRICDVLSLITSTAMFIAGFFLTNWIYTNILAIGICVGAIKLFRFSSMKQAFLSMLISICFVTVIAIVFHFVLSRSYNDYATELSSPLFILIPDMIDQLYKKCSWLPVIDVIVPGVFLSFLRTYDQNYNTGWGGVYTVIGNLSFILSTVLWILLQAVYPYSVPFSLVTYVCLALSIFVISSKRNQMKTLWEGRFNGANNQMTTHLLSTEQSQDRKSFGKLVTPDMMQSIKVGEYDSQIMEESKKINQVQHDIK